MTAVDDAPIDPFVIRVGDCRHDTRIGPIIADRRLSPSLLELLVSEFQRQRVDPKSCVAAHIRDEDSIKFEMVQL